MLALLALFLTAQRKLEHRSKKRVRPKPLFDGLRGLSLDALTGLRWTILGNDRPPQGSPVVVVALDEETCRTPPFEGTPNVTWTREIGRVLTDIVEGGASVVGFDIVFPVSIEQSRMLFGDETLGVPSKVGALQVLDQAELLAEWKLVEDSAG